MGESLDATGRAALALARDAVERYVRTALVAEPPAELPPLAYEVNVVDPLEAVSSLADLDPRTYGVLVEAGGRRGVLLPDLDGVDTAERQVEIARAKAGLPAGSAVRLYRFQVRRFREPDR